MHTSVLRSVDVIAIAVLVGIVGSMAVAPGCRPVGDDGEPCPEATCVGGVNVYMPWLNPDVGEYEVTIESAGLNGSFLCRRSTAGFQLMEPSRAGDFTSVLASCGVGDFSIVDVYPASLTVTVATGAETHSETFDEVDYGNSGDFYPGCDVDCDVADIDMAEPAR